MELPKIENLLKYNDLLSTIENLPYATGIFDRDFKYLYFNRAGEKMSGISLADAQGKTPSEIMPPELAQLFQPIVQKARDEKITVKDTIKMDFGFSPIYLSVTYIPVLDKEGNVTKIIGITEDVTTEKKYEEQLIHNANYDFLTGLQNRNSFNSLKNSLTGTENPFFLVFIDLDNFKSVNDAYGHEMGDRLLVEVTKRLLKISSTEKIYRFGGDEFILIFEKIEEAEKEKNYIQDIINGFVDPFQVNEKEIYITASAGISIFPSHGKTVDVLLKSADIALYKAKEAKNIYCIFNEELQKKADSDFELEYLLHKASDNKEIDVYFQPIVDRNGLIIGSEGLSRWNIKGRPVPPDQFIPILEKSNLIYQVSEQIFRKAVETNLHRNRITGKKNTISLNVSPKQMDGNHITSLIRSIIKEYSIDPDMIQLEVTENLLIRNEEEAIQIFNELRSIGVRLAIDDFGVGYSSLNYLRKFPFHSLKIDKSFVFGIEEKSNYLLVKSIIQLAHDLGLVTVAEGIETEKQWNSLKDLHCDFFQGYYFHRPMNRDAFLSISPD